MLYLLGIFRGKVQPHGPQAQLAQVILAVRRRCADDGQELLPIPLLQYAIDSREDVAVKLQNPVGMYWATNIVHVSLCVMYALYLKFGNVGKFAVIRR